MIFVDCSLLFFLWVVFTCVLFLPCTFDGWVPILDFYLQGFSSHLAQSSPFCVHHPMLGDFHTYIYVCVYILGELLLNQLTYSCKNQHHIIFLKQKNTSFVTESTNVSNVKWFSNLLVLTKVITIDYFQ